MIKTKEESTLEVLEELIKTKNIYVYDLFEIDKSNIELNFTLFKLLVSKNDDFTFSDFTISIVYPKSSNSMTISNLQLSDFLLIFKRNVNDLHILEKLGIPSDTPSEEMETYFKNMKVKEIHFHNKLIYPL